MAHGFQIAVLRVEVVWWNPFSAREAEVRGRPAWPQCQLQAEKTYSFPLLHSALLHKAFIWNKNASVTKNIKHFKKTLNWIFKEAYLGYIWGREQFSHFMSLQVRVQEHSKYTFAWDWLLCRSHFKYIYLHKIWRFFFFFFFSYNTNWFNFWAL